MKYPNVPELNFSLNLNATYKGFDVSMLLHAVGNYTFDFSGRGIYDWNGNGVEKNYFELHEFAWTEDKAANGGDIRYPRMHPDGITVSKQPSNYWLIDMWYMRIKNLELGYTFSKDSNMFSSNLYYRQTSDKIEQKLTINEDDKILVMSISEVKR